VHLLYRIALGLRPLYRLPYRAEASGAERIPATRACVLVANHECIFDGLFVGLATDRVVRWMTKAELFEHPVTRAVMTSLACFPVSRGSSRAGRAVDHGLELLERGEILGVFPQGTCLPYRNRRFQRGAARLAMAAGVPVVPIALVGTERVLQPRTHRIGFPTVRVVVGDPIEVERRRPTVRSAAALTDQVEQAIETLRAPYGEPQHAWIG
jgi:1-acyl-sn-glycerol-3-phosphate acyltransferase